MDDRPTRAAHARRIRELVTTMEVDGGDVLAVILGQLERFALGVERYGPLDLDDGHDWQAEEDEELSDVENYRAIKRMLARRGVKTRSAARRDQHGPNDASDPTWTGEGPRLARERLERRRG